jgi:hypothetical protein
MAEKGDITRLARCACGQLQAICSGDPHSVSLCHCRECQRRTGSIFGIAAFYSRESVALSGTSTVYERPSDNGFAVAHHFCSICASTVFWYPTRKPALIAVAVGAFADPGFPAPTQVVYRQHRHDWLTIACEGAAP